MIICELTDKDATNRVAVGIVFNRLPRHDARGSIDTACRLYKLLPGPINLRT